MLARAVQKNVPDILQQAASTPVTPLAMVDEILPVQYLHRRPHWQRLAAACLMLLLSVGALSFGIGVAQSMQDQVSHPGGRFHRSQSFGGAVAQPLLLCHQHPCQQR